VLTDAQVNSIVKSATVASAETGCDTFREKESNKTDLSLERHKVTNENQIEREDPQQKSIALDTETERDKELDNGETDDEKWCQWRERRDKRII